MYKCEACGKELTKRTTLYGHVVCSKHMHQLLDNGKFLDNNPRTEKDLNEFRYLDEVTVEFDVYNMKQEVIGHFIIDAADLELVRYHKWRLSTHDRIITGNATKKHPVRDLSRFLLAVTDQELVVDHINGNHRDNRRQNLRICTQAQNVMNKSYMSTNTSEFIGVPFDQNRHRWAPEISAGWQRIHLGRYKDKTEAIYARYIAELILFKEYRNTNDDERKLKLFEEISEERKEEIRSYIENKIRLKTQ